jgi:aspartate/methionine/tyrosine aminotransferase
VTRFSNRLPWQLQPNEISRLIARKKEAGAPLLDLTESNPTHAGFDYPPEILNAFQDSRSLVYDPKPEGLMHAREAVSRYYSERRVEVAPDRILLTASTSEAYSFLFKLLADPGDEVLAPRPSYPLFEFLANLESVRIVQYPLVYHEGWFIDFEALRSAITARTRAVVLVNPNNPTGSYLKNAEWVELSRICQQRKIAVISDEVFGDYYYAASDSRVWTLASSKGPLAFSLSGLSKVAGMPQMKLGWIVPSGEGSVDAWKRLELISDTFLSVSTPVQYAAPSLMPAGDQVRRQIRSRIASNRDALRDLRVLEAEGGWYAVIQVPRIRSEEDWVLTLLDKHNVLVQPGYFFDFANEAFLVVSLLAAPEVFQEGIQRLRAFLE